MWACISNTLHRGPVQKLLNLTTKWELLKMAGPFLDGTQGGCARSNHPRICLRRIGGVSAPVLDVGVRSTPRGPDEALLGRRGPLDPLLLGWLICQVVCGDSHLG